MFCVGLGGQFSVINHGVYWVFVGNSELVSGDF